MITELPVMRTHDALPQSRSLPALNGDMAPGDMGDVLAALVARLRSLAPGAAAAGDQAPGNRRAAVVHADPLAEGLLECESTLVQIRATVMDELARRNALERELADTQSALAQALAELCGTGAGERHALHLAHHDGLTALPNATYFIERLDEELNNRAGRRQSLAVLCLDLDGFHSFNARHGHDTGNELLRIVGVRLSRAVRADDMVCRLEGDQFGFLLADVHGHSQLAGLAGKLADAIAAPLQIGKRSLRIHANIGIAVSPQDGVHSTELMRNAGVALQAAKQRQTPFAFFEAAPAIPASMAATSARPA